MYYNHYLTLCDELQSNIWQSNQVWWMAEHIHLSVQGQLENSSSNEDEDEKINK